MAIRKSSRPTSCGRAISKEGVSVGRGVGAGKGLGVGKGVRVGDRVLVGLGEGVTVEVMGEIGAIVVEGMGSSFAGPAQELERIPMTSHISSFLMSFLSS